MNKTSTNSNVSRGHKQNNKQNTTSSSVIFQQILKWLQIAGAIIVPLSIAYYVGHWVASIEYKVEIMNLNQMHNNEKSEMKIEYNKNLLEIQSKYDMLEKSYNDIKDRKEDDHE